MDNWEMIVIAISMAIIALAVVAFFIALTYLVVTLHGFSKKTKREMHREEDELDETVSSFKRYFKEDFETTEGKISGILKGALLGLSIWQEYKHKRRK